jgi:hypothetical protein
MMVCWSKDVMLLLNTGYSRMVGFVRWSREHHIIDLLSVSEGKMRRVSAAVTQRGGSRGKTLLIEPAGRLTERQWCNSVSWATEEGWLCRRNSSMTTL